MNNSLREIVSSQISRARELQKELEQEVKSDIKNRQVSYKTLEITEDLLTKLRNCLDKLINQYWESKTGSKSTKMYFPIATDQKDLNEKLARYGLKDLSTSDSNLFQVISAVQPYTSQDYVELIELHMYGSQEKHRNLSIQEKQVVAERINFSTQSGSVNWNPSAVKFGSGVHVLGVPINPITQLPAYTPSTHELKKENFIAIKFQGKNIDVLNFCRSVTDIVEKISGQIINLT